MSDDDKRWGPGVSLGFAIGAALGGWFFVVAFLTGLRTIAGWFR